LPQSLKRLDLTSTAPVKDNVEGSGEGILVVEDDDQVREYIVETLVGLNYRVFAARDATNALEVFQKVRSELSLILTDVIMPGKNGRVLSEELLQLEPGLRVLFMTGYSRDAFASDLDRHIELLQKPISQAALAERVHNLLSATK
jgi:CheY-like chemotaxis protein